MWYYCCSSYPKYSVAHWLTKVPILFDSTVWFVLHNWAIGLFIKLMPQRWQFLYIINIFLHKTGLHLFILSDLTQLGQDFGKK